MKRIWYYFLTLIIYTSLFAQQNEVKVQNHLGVPTLMVNGHPDAGMTYMTYSPKEKYFNDFAKAGVRFVSFLTQLQQFPVTNELVWVKRDSFNFNNFDSTVNFILKANPDALIFPRVYLFAADWWMKENPDELMVYHDGEKYKPTGGRAGATALPSWASQKWRKDTEYCLRMFIRHIAKQKWASHIVGYHLASGGYDEWFYYCYYNWFDNMPQNDFLDYSKPQTEAFRKWLQKKYMSVEKIQSSWNDKQVTFENAVFASKKERKENSLFQLYDPQKSMHAVDSWDFESDLVAETIRYFCRVVKDETKGKAFTGAFYGYILGANDRGYCATRSILDCPDIDFLTSPSSYWFREAGTGYSTFRTPIRSLQLAGKLFWDENDYHTFLTPDWKWNNGGWGGSPDLNSTINQQMRQLAAQIQAGAAGWWFDQDGGWYDTPELMASIQKLNKIGEKSVRFDRSSVAEIAMVVDEKSMLYLAMGNDLYYSWILEQPGEFGHIGAPVDWIMLEDIEKSKPYKMYVMLNMLHVTDAQKGIIRKLQNGMAKTLVWVYAPGLFTDKADVENCNDLIGIKLKIIKDKSPLLVEINEKGHQILPSLYAGYKYGTNYKIGPVMAANDPDAQTLGTVYGFDEQGFVLKNIKGVETYYTASPKLSYEMLHAIAVRSGIHIYDDVSDGIYVNKSFFSLQAIKGGKRTLSFPVPVNLYDVYNGKTIATNVSSVTIELPARTTAIYFIGTKQEWENK